MVLSCPYEADEAMSNHQMIRGIFSDERIILNSGSVEYTDCTSAEGIRPPQKKQVSWI